MPSSRGANVSDEMTDPSHRCDYPATGPDVGNWWTCPVCGRISYTRGVYAAGLGCTGITWHSPDCEIAREGDVCTCLALVTFSWV